MPLCNRSVPIEYGAFRAQVLNGEIPVNIFISLEMARIDELIASPDYYYDSQAIEGWIAFCEAELTLTDGEPLYLLPSFKLWAEQLLAWYHFPEETIYDVETNQYIKKRVKRRLCLKQYLIIARGGAKTMYASLMQSYFAIVDTSTTHQVVTAPTMKQAEETMQPIRTAIARARGPLMRFLTEGDIRNTSGSRANRPKIASTKKGIENFMTNTLIEIRPMSIDKLQGLRSKINTVDEWLSGKVIADPIGALEQGASKLEEYVIIATSSEGTVRGGVGDQVKLELARILYGETHAPHISIWHYKLDDVKEVADPSKWLKANPNIGATVSYAAYHRDVLRAESEPAARNDILAKRFGIPLEGFTYFFTYEETLPHRPFHIPGYIGTLGADMSQGDDFCAFVILFDLGAGRFGAKCKAFVSDLKVQKLSEVMREKYNTFVAEGTLIIQEGAILDMMLVYDEVDKWIMENEYTIEGFGYDPYNADSFVNRWNVENGPYGVHKVIQGARTESVPLGEIKKLAAERWLVFDEEIMKFSMENSIALEDNNGNRKLSKRRAEEKIDLVAALMDARIAWNRNQEVR